MAGALFTFYGEQTLIPVPISSRMFLLLMEKVGGWRIENINLLGLVLKIDRTYELNLTQLSAKT